MPKVSKLFVFPKVDLYMTHCKMLFDYLEDPRDRMARVVPTVAKTLHHLVRTKGLGDKKSLKDLKPDEPYGYIVESLCVLLAEKSFIKDAPVRCFLF